MLGLRKVGGEHFILPLFLLISTLVIGQVTVKTTKGVPIEYVQVFDDDHNFDALSDSQGSVDLGTLADSIELNFVFMGFRTKRFSVEELREQGLVVLEYAPHELEAVEVIGRQGLRREEVVQQIETVTSEELAFTNPQTSADALDQHSGLYVQKSQMGGGSPIIRGFEANKILLVVDGVRMNNAIYRNGHLQNAITIGGSMLERIEVLYGPGSVGYGSDALGGVIHFKTKDPRFSWRPGAVEVAGSGLFRVSTANQENTVQAELNIGGHKFASLTNFSYSDFSHLQTGNKRDDSYPNFGTRPDFQRFVDGRDTVIKNSDPNEQVGTAYHQFDLLQKFRYQPTHDLVFVANFQYSTSSDVPRYDNLTERDDENNLSWGEWYYGPQKRLLASIKANWLSPTLLFDHAQVIVAMQQIGEDRITRRFGHDVREYQEEEVRVWSTTLDFTKSFDDESRHQLLYGLDFQDDEVVSLAFSEHVHSSERMNDILTRYPDAGSGMRTIGGYVKYAWQSASKHNRFEIGGRIGNTVTDMHYERTDIIEWPPDFTDGVQNKNTALTGSVSWKGKMTSWLRYRLMTSTAYRVPNIDDLAKIRARGDFVLVPNLDLEPERSATFEGTLSGEWTELFKLPESRIQLDVTGYYTLLDDAIIRSNYQLPNGDTLLEVSGEFLRVQANINAKSAYIYGLSANLQVEFNKNWILKSSFNTLKGRSEIGDEGEMPLAHIPPNYGQTSVQYAANKWQLGVVVRYNGRKSIDEFAPGSSDNEDFATPQGSLPWTTINIYGSLKFTDYIGVTAALENIANVHYRLFSSGVSAPGRNFIISLNGNF